MPRRKLARRFEPRCGVSEFMLEEECKWMSRELDDILIHSPGELTERLKQVQASLVASDASLRHDFDHADPHHVLALRIMLARDLYHISALYEKFLTGRVTKLDRLQTRPKSQTGSADPAAGPAAPEPIHPGTFKEWLFPPPK
jgi:hypothetical protein